MSPIPNSQPLRVIDPSLQVSFFYRLQALRRLYLQEALAATVRVLDLRSIDVDLDRCVDPVSLRTLASHGLRGELVFPVATVLRANPYLLGYYRLLYGISQKEAYNKGRLGPFKHMEERGIVPPRVVTRIEELCRSLISTGEMLVRGLDSVSIGTLHELQLLTIGPQLRGSENTRIGTSAAAAVFKLIVTLSAPRIEEQTDRFILIRNSSSRPVLVEMSSDPDVRIYEQLPTGIQPLIAIEIKGGGDASNVHNRIGEAEKSHQKARKLGYTECWTILRAGVNFETARQESPTTTQFFRLDALKIESSDEHHKFRDMLASRLGIPIG